MLSCGLFDFQQPGTLRSSMHWVLACPLRALWSRLLSPPLVCLLGLQSHVFLQNAFIDYYLGTKSRTSRLLHHHPLLFNCLRCWLGSPSLSVWVLCEMETSRHGIGRRSPLKKWVQKTKGAGPASTGLGLRGSCGRSWASSWVGFLLTLKQAFVASQPWEA